ncbi:MAG: hypothetical protein LBL57_03915, partial [Tannerella sp.]|nr:hypothetical protein [Tannerella sp.]
METIFGPVSRNQAIRAVVYLILYMVVSMLFAWMLLDFTIEMEKKYRESVMWGIQGLGASLIITISFALLFFTWIALGAVVYRLIRGKDRLMPHIIYPFPMVLNTDMVKPDDLTGTYFSRADDEFMVITCQDRRYALWGGGGFTVICTPLLIDSVQKLKMIAGTLDYPELDDKIMDVGFGFCFWMVGFVIFLYGIFMPRKQFIFDRMRGLVTIPGPFIFRKRTIPFKDVVPACATGMLAFSHPVIGISMAVIGEYGISDWSFYVLYMDKNWPLPQGTAFDPYRERDFKRRQAEGFPQPVYKNEIWVCDAYSGYIYGTEAFKEKIAAFKYNLVQAHDAICYESAKWGINISNDNDLVLIGTYGDYFLFRLFAPQHQQYIVIDEAAEVSDCFLVHGMTKKVRYIQSPLAGGYASLPASWKPKPKTAAKIPPQDRRPGYFPLSVKEINKTGDEELLPFIMNDLGERLLLSGDKEEYAAVMTFSKPQQAVHIVALFEEEVTIGGFTHYYASSGRLFAALLPDALRLVGAVRLAD